MTIFDEITNIHGRIKKVQEKIAYLQFKADCPRTSTISDMPKGGGHNVGNPLEEYMIKKEELTHKLNSLRKRLALLWEKAEHLMKTANTDDQTIEMMKLRFLWSMPWEKCAKQMSKTYPQDKWNINKCFRKYRDVLYKIRRLNRQEQNS